MKKGMCQWAMFAQDTVKHGGNSAVGQYPWGTEFARSFAMFKKAGFDGVELELKEEGPIGLDSTEEDMKKIKKAADDVSLELVSLCLGILWKYPLSADDKEVTEKGKSIVRKALELASYLSMDTILVIPGKVHAPFGGPEVVQYDVAYRRALDTIRELAKDAERYKVNIGIENVWNKMLLTPLEMANFIDEVASEYVGAYFDVGNVMVSGFPEHWIRILGKRIKKVHFKDFKVAIGNINGFCNLLEGDVNWPEVMKALKEIGYDDFVIAELFPGKFYPKSLIYQTSIAMDYILSRK